MSHTNHDTPSFPRTLRGPRGGRHTSPTPCAECVSFTSCRPGPCSAPFGCDSWVDFDGRRVDLEAEYSPRPDAIPDGWPQVCPFDQPKVCNDPRGCPKADDCGAIVHPEDIPEGLTADDWAGMTPAERDTAEGIDGLTRLPEPPPHADPSVRWDLEAEDIPEPDDPDCLGPLFQR